MTALRSFLPFGPQSGTGEGPEVGHGHARPRRGCAGSRAGVPESPGSVLHFRPDRCSVMHMTQTARHPLTATIGQTITDKVTDRTVTVRRHDPRDHDCGECGGLVRVWTRHTLARPKIAGPGAYDQAENSAHLLATGLLGPCPGRP